MNARLLWGRPSLAAVCSLVILLAGCQPAAGSPVPTPGVTTMPTGVPAAPPPPVLPSAVAGPTATAAHLAAAISAPQLPTPLATVTRAATAVATVSPSPTTPPPTYTPPPPPPPEPGEHLLFGRPVPESVAQWTDKAYPYGSTRGGTLQPHHGVEFAVPAGTPVLAVAPGVVRVAGPDDQIAYGPQTNFYGNVVIIEHSASPNGLALFTVYGHLSQVDVAVGQQVAAQQPIGLSGDSGVAYGPHLHLEVREGSNTYLSTRNPVLWLRPFEGIGVVAGRVTYANGQPAAEVPITLRRVDGPAPYAATTSYAVAPVNGDLVWQENFALDDVPAGYYEITAGTGATTVSQTLWVFPGRTTLVALVLP